LGRTYLLLACYAITAVAWYGLGRYMGSDIFPDPLITLSAVVKIVTNPHLVKHLGITGGRVILGVLASMLGAVLIVILARYIGPFRVYYLRVLYPVVRAIPTVAIALLAIVWFGLGTGSVVFVIVVTVLPIYMVNLWEGLKVIDATLVEMATALTSDRARIFRKVILPMLVPILFSSTKLSFSVAFKLALVGELLASTSGMGFMIYIAQQDLKTDMVFAWTFLMLAFVVLFEHFVFDVTERKYLYRWETGT
jgi:NitT/TauT family transport system permease protein